MDEEMSGYDGPGYDMYEGAEDATMRDEETDADEGYEDVGADVGVDMMGYEDETAPSNKPKRSRRERRATEMMSP